jgi:MOSC domain-containing protein YiiM/ferredoxin
VAVVVGKKVMPRLLSVNVGLPRDIAWRGKTVRTAIWKTPVQGGRMVRRLNIDGDGQGDLAGHGGENRAVFVYQTDSYLYWQSQLGRNDFTYGQFGENFTVDGLSDQEVCIGDRYRLGGALFEVTQPRVTCYRVGIRMEEPQMAALLVAHGRPGFYLRVLEEGEVEAGDEILRVASGPERMSVFEINALLYMPGHPRGQLERALRIPALSAGWRGSLEALLAQERSGGATTGNAGLTQASGPPPAWPGFRPLRVSRKERESSSVISLVLEPADGLPLTAALFDAPGRLDMRVLQELGVPCNGDFYICGPTAFMSDLTAGLAAWGTAASRIHTEIFGAGPSNTPGVAASPRRPPHLPAGPPSAGPLVSFARSGLNVRWGPAFQSLLELAEACDVPVRWSCRTGVCHTCETGLVVGTVGYRPDPVDAPAAGNVLICCSQPDGDIVIDL